MVKKYDVKRVKSLEEVKNLKVNMVIKCNGYYLVGFEK